MSPPPVRAAIVLAAGRGERMRPLTDTCPKPLLAVRGRPLVAWHLEALARAGVRDVVVNTAWLEEAIVAALGDGAGFGLSIRYSREGLDHGGALETAGALRTALPLLALAPGENFWCVSADVFTPDFDFADGARPLLPADGAVARLWLTANPAHHPEGDFGIGPDGLATVGPPRYTWTGIGLFRREFVTDDMAVLAAGERARLRPFLEAAIARRALAAVRWTGAWADVGTPQRLNELNEAAL